MEKPDGQPQIKEVDRDERANNSHTPDEFVHNGLGRHEEEKVLVTETRRQDEEVEAGTVAPSSELIETDRDGSPLTRSTVEPELSDGVKQLQQAFAELAHDFRSKLQYDAHKNQIIDKLHAELQEYRNDLIRKLLRPMVLDTIMVADDIRKLVRGYRNRDPEDMDPLKFLDLMEGIADDLDNLLYRQGVEGFRVEGEDFDPKRQKVLVRVPTEDPDKDKAVSERIRCGYQWDDRVIRPEMVAVHVVQQPAENPEPEPQNETNQTEGHNE